MFFGSAKTVQTSTRRSRPLRRAARGTCSATHNRWVHREELRIGMYVNELDIPWEQTCFVFQGFEIDSLETLRALQLTCDYANVQTEKPLPRQHRGL